MIVQSLRTWVRILIVPFTSSLTPGKISNLWGLPYELEIIIKPTSRGSKHIKWPVAVTNICHYFLDHVCPARSESLYFICLLNSYPSFQAQQKFYLLQKASSEYPVQPFFLLLAPHPCSNLDLQHQHCSELCVPVFLPTRLHIAKGRACFSCSACVPKSTQPCVSHRAKPIALSLQSTHTHLSDSHSLRQVPSSPLFYR